MRKNISQKSNKKSDTKDFDKNLKTRYHLILTGIILITIIVYSNSMRNEILHFDDNEYFSFYPEILNLSWNSIKAYFSNYYVMMYQPLPILSFALNYHFTGLDTFPMHLVNLCFHLVNIILVFYFIRLLTTNNTIALVVVLLFAIHPMNIESVSWISARSSTMYSFFYILSLIFYIKYLKKFGKTRYLIYSGFFFIFSLFSKAQAVTLPVVLVLLDYYFNRKVSWVVFIEKLPFFILSVIFGIITISNKDTIINITEGGLTSYSNADIFFMVSYSFMFYIFKLFIPLNLCGIHVFPPKYDGYLPWEYYIAPLLFFMILFLIFKFRQKKYFVFGALLFLITISINIQIIPSRLFIVAERYTYFPYIGIFFILGYFYNELYEGKHNRYRKSKIIFNMLLILYCIISIITIWERNKIWKNDFVFSNDLIKKNPDVPYKSKMYGGRGNYYLKINKAEKAVADYSKAIELNPDVRWFFNRAMAFKKMNKLHEALSDLDSAAKYKPDGALIFSNRASLKLKFNDIDGAYEDCNLCIELDTTIPQAYNMRASIELIRRNYQNCENDLNKAISLKPDYSKAYKNRGVLYFITNRKILACNDWQTAINLGNPIAVQLWNMHCKQ